MDVPVEIRESHASPNVKDDTCFFVVVLGKPSFLEQVQMRFLVHLLNGYARAKLLDDFKLGRQVEAVFAYYGDVASLKISLTGKRHRGKNADLFEAAIIAVLDTHFPHWLKTESEVVEDKRKRFVKLEETVSLSSG